MSYKILIDMAGDRHGRLVGLAYSHRSRSGHAHWLFACDCGAQVVVNGANVRAGNTTSCGCAHREISAARLLVHGRRAARRHDATYRAWQTMNADCTNPEASGYDRCGRRGVRVCPVWRGDFPRFLEDLGERPNGTVLCRSDESADFAPANCMWAPARSREARAAAGWSRRMRSGEDRPSGAFDARGTPQAFTVPRRTYGQAATEPESQDV